MQNKRLRVEKYLVTAGLLILQFIIYKLSDMWFSQRIMDNIQPLTVLLDVDVVSLVKGKKASGNRRKW